MAQPSVFSGLTSRRGIVAAIVVICLIGVAAAFLLSKPDAPEQSLADKVTKTAPSATEKSQNEKSQKKASPSTAEMAIGADEMFLGDANAPVTIIEYASMTCPHCANFHIKDLPAIKKAYIDTGKVRLVFREYPLDKVAFMASVLARCSGKDRFFGFIDIMFRRQANWAGAEDPVKALSQLAQMGGVGKADFEACLADKDLGDSILKTRIEGQDKFDVNSTPSFVIDGKKIKGPMNVDTLARIIGP